MNSASIRCDSRPACATPQLQTSERSLWTKFKSCRDFWIAFDPGIKKALDRTLKSPVVPGTSAYGDAFEHWFFLELHRRSRYARNDWQFSFVRTKAGVEIDLVIERPGAPMLLVEIKSKTRVTADDAKSLGLIGPDLDKNAECILISQDPVTQRFGNTQALPWYDALPRWFES